MASIAAELQSLLGNSSTIRDSEIFLVEICQKKIVISYFKC